MTVNIVYLALAMEVISAAPITTRAGTLPPATTPQPAMAVLTIGDSITEGNSSNGGYRLPLQALLAADDITFDFIGPATSNSEGMSDPEHAGYGGERIDEIEARLPTIEDTPDIILLHIGTNDLYQEYQLDTVNARLASLLAAMRAKWPAARIIVAKVGPYTGEAEYIAGMNAAAISYNAYIDSLTDAEPVYMPLTAALIGDGVHPTPAGYVVMAQAWHRAIVRQIWMPWITG